MMLVAIVCAVLGAACSAVGAQLQHRGVRAETTESGLTLRKLGRLVRNPQWLRGFLVLFACAVLQILALTFAPVTVVAPIVVLALPMVALLNARELDVAGWIAVAATSAAIALFVSSTAGAVVEERDIVPSAVLSAGQYVGLGVLVLCLLAFGTQGTVRCMALAMAAGAAYGLVAVLVRDVTFTVRTEGLAATPLLSLAGLVLAFLAGSWLIQLGYASGPPDVVVGSQTVLNPVVATAIGFFLLGEARGVEAGLLTRLVVCGVVAIAGVAVLARHHPDAIERRRLRRAARTAGTS
ncbi:hypothetical protein B0I33_112116 [Prauserella shujinwangii]|uniref:Magnesium transporter NIPA n=1 Tax=Prauserella shujinwangii TaxID=1453103 RepID=A0A2T0LMC8_9PSEU|nr:DMT family transporter [Prauserella shujinwangii]PRX44238.1 hypothetical protein B0I33_112116 [Prauserella shujinwangii]